MAGCSLRLAVVGIACACQLTACKPIVRQEPVSTDKFVIPYTMVRATWRLVTVPLRGYKNSILSMVKKLAKQKNYDQLEGQLSDISDHISDMRINYEQKTAKHISKMLSDPKTTSEAEDIERLKAEVNEDYISWAKEVKERMHKALQTNPIYRPDMSNVPLGLDRTAYPRLKTMGELVNRVNNIIKTLETPLF